MFAKIVIIEEKDVIDFNLKDDCVGCFAIFFDNELTVCHSLTHAKLLVKELENV